MYAYITHGTYGYMRKMKERHPEERLILMVKENDAFLYHETGGKTLFRSGSAFELFHSYGHWEHAKLAVFHHYPIRDEGKPIFEDELKRSDDGLLGNGALCIRGLRPLKGSTYILITCWHSKGDYLSWAVSHPNHPLPPGHDAVLSKQSYVTEYIIQQEE